MSDPTGRALAALESGAKSVTSEALKHIWEVIPSRGEKFDLDTAKRIFAFIDSVVTAVAQGFGRTLSPDEVRAELERLRLDIDNDLTATKAMIEEIKTERDPTIDRAIEAARAKLPKRDED